MYKHLAVFGYYDQFLAHKANPADKDAIQEAENEFKDIPNFIKNFNLRNLK